MIRYRIKTRAEMSLMEDFNPSTGIPTTWPKYWATCGLLGLTVPKSAEWNRHLCTYSFNVYTINEKYLVEMNISDATEYSYDRGTLLFASNYNTTGTVIGYACDKDESISAYIVRRTDNTGWMLSEIDASRYKIDSKYIKKNVYLFNKETVLAVRSEKNLTCLPSGTITDSSGSLQSHRNVLQSGTRIKSKFDTDISAVIIGNYAGEDITEPLYLIIRDDGIGWQLHEDSSKKYNTHPTHIGKNVWSIVASKIEVIEEEYPDLHASDDFFPNIKIVKIKSPEQPIRINKRATLLTPLTIKKRLLI